MWFWESLIEWLKYSQVCLTIREHEFCMVRDKGARLKGKRNLSLTLGLKVLYNEYRQQKENELSSQWIIGKEYFDKKSCSGWWRCAAYINVWFRAPNMIVQWGICKIIWIPVYLLSSYKACIIEYLHKQQYLTGLARTLLNTINLFNVCFAVPQWLGHLLHPHECGLCTHHISWLPFGCHWTLAWGPLFFLKNP